MRRALPIGVATLVALVGTTGAAGSGAPVFRVVADAPKMTFTVEAAPRALPSAETPNAPGSLLLPQAWLSRRESPGVPLSTLTGLWRRAGAAYGIPWQVLAAINKIESNFGRNMGPSSAGAVGWMQFMPSTWERWGTDANGDRVADPWNAEDAIFSAARYLAAAGGRDDLYRGVFAYNHAHWYVRDVLDLARAYGHSPGAAAALDGVQVDVERARRAVAAVNRSLVVAVRREQALARLALESQVRAARARLLSARLDLQKRAFADGTRQLAASRRVARLRKKLTAAQKALEEARTAALATSFGTGTATLVAAPLYSGDYVFPVGGGPEQISVAHTHHDYPAADIAAPMGAPLYALARGIVEDAWPMPTGACGIGFTLRAADGRTWTYCHLSYLEPSVRPGTALTAGAPVGLVGSTGHSTGPHLHLQLQPATSYPQAEAWFAGFAGRAFTWQDEATPDLDAGVFAVVDGAEDAEPVVRFTLER